MMPWIALLAEKLPRLRIARMTFNGEISVSLACRPLMRQFNNVVQLYLHWNAYVPFLTLARYLVSFPRLSRLCISGPCLHHPDPSEIHPRRLLGLLQRLPQVTYLHRKGRSFPATLTDSITREVFEAFASSVEIIQWGGDPAVTEMLPEHDLPYWHSFSRLQTICFALHIPHQGLGDTRQLSYLAFWLANVRTACLKHVVLLLDSQPGTFGLDLLAKLEGIKDLDEALYGHHPTVATLTVCYKTYGHGTIIRSLRELDPFPEAGSSARKYWDFVAPFTRCLEKRLPLIVTKRELRVYICIDASGSAKYNPLPDIWLQATPDDDVRWSPTTPQGLAELDLDLVESTPVFSK
ncbi:hypothetical protein OH77DRAFT_1420595 [Trametes cingulata]|nr:hypothetical protein OH77DRAFT_1420595 [Trametes cingulata]